MSKSTPQKPETASVDDDAIIDGAITELQASLDVLAARRAALPPGGFDPELAAATASTAKAMLLAAGERRQQGKQRKRDLAAFSDDEIIEYMRGLQERRREAIITAAQGASLAGRPLFG